MDLRLSLLSVIAVAILALAKGQSVFDESACISLTPPASAGTPATSNNIFLASAVTTYTPGGNPIAVFLVSQGGPTEFTSLILQARRDDNSCPVGSFTLPANGFEYLNCGRFSEATITTSQQTEMNFAFMATWTPPPQSYGSVSFYASFIDGSNNVYDNLRSFQPLTTADGPVALTVSCPANTQSSGSFTTPMCMRGAISLGEAVCDPPSGSISQTGNTMVNCTCNDCNDEATCTFIVEIDNVDTECNFCPFGQVCRVASSLAGYTCHSSVGVSCIDL